jgi:hypothetical protein
MVKAMISRADYRTMKVSGLKTAIPKCFESKFELVEEFAGTARILFCPRVPCYPAAVMDATPLSKKDCQSILVAIGIAIERETRALESCSEQLPQVLDHFHVFVRHGYNLL